MDPTPNEAALDEAVAGLLDAAGITAQRKLIARILSAGLGLGHDGASRLDLKITAAAVEEMRAAYRLFKPYSATPKVTIFGSARTRAHDPLWVGAEGVARGLTEQGWMVVTGAGPGIMEAAATGAGPDRALGVSIRLPFEERPNSALAQDNGHLVSMKYFFTRKLMLVKESRGFVCLPGGFGTMDETFELLTLQQTGKMEPVPIVLLDRPDGTFWRGFARFVTEELAGSGMIAVDDLDRVLVTDSVDAAIDEITGFWRNYDSLRWFDDRLVLRLRAEPSDAELAELGERFSGLCLTGGIERTEPFPAERSDRDRLELPRIVLVPRERAVGDLYRLIRALNELPSAPPPAVAETHPAP
ncbi:TIGR00730 family Rossman fold protein [Leucobacter sp. CSA1]|uniref:TIGR00730 family Rossman fold protein n=1 Tax=Leucobacter chromiisoli TaxID=2796471 RepID=A0A934UUH0_9MICO|nr:TIGR00730 family Rossman fold protein [Leucobacter chromiisoli]MBK0418416.1 TIGR00730 family Rossman fold protein [Leucobacter chromiisoli]